jgi:hypothetical protein
VKVVSNDREYEYIPLAASTYFRKAWRRMLRLPGTIEIQADCVLNVAEVRGRGVDAQSLCLGTRLMERLQVFEISPSARTINSFSASCDKASSCQDGGHGVIRLIAALDSGVCQSQQGHLLDVGSCPVPGGRCHAGTTRKFWVMGQLALLVL